jgi:dTDP-4-amino-4,6-dideoxy-D-galactose acyltransferase
MMHLTWDSDFFGKKIGKITISDENKTTLGNELANAYAENYALMYVFAEKGIEISDEILEKFNGKLVDKKIIYTSNIEDLHTKYFVNISEFSENQANILYDLAYLSGNYSRFRLDERLGIDNFKRLYREWIDKSVSHEIARKIFVYTEAEIKGMITLGVKDKTATIGLLAVDESLQGRGVGLSLINACVTYCKIEQIEFLDVPTQLDNEQACRFYEKCGFQAKSVQNIYHFWQ